VELRPASTKDVQRDFIRLPGRRPYGTYDNDAGAEAAWLAGRHTLNAGLTVAGVVAYDRGRPIGRIAVTTAADDPATAWVGFLETPDGATSDALFDWAHRTAADLGRTRLVGPVDASFWHRYRLKVSGFDEQPYVGEPLNPPAHVTWWERAGYAETDRYRSALYVRARPEMEFPRFDERLARFEERGFTFSHPTAESWDETMTDLHAMLHELYAPMAAFRPIPLDTFLAHYARLRPVVDLSMVWLVHRDGRPEGFCVTLPDYGVGLTTGPMWRRLWTLARNRRRSERYVLAYLGARTPGVGSALMQGFVAELVRRRSAPVGSLTHVGVSSEGYAAQFVRARNEYVLLARDL
jgi:hypothetical protein